MIGGGPFQLKPGEWTDDTSMVLCLAETYLSENRMHTDILRNISLNGILTVIIAVMVGVSILAIRRDLRLNSICASGLPGMVIPRNTLLVMLGLFVKLRCLSFVENRCVRFTSNPRLRVAQPMAR